MQLSDTPPPRIHGGLRVDELREHGTDPDHVVDFSSNLNPYGPCGAVREALTAARIDCYPDPTALPAREALSRVCGAVPDRVVAGNGAAGLLWSLANALVQPRQPVVVATPTFAEFPAAVAARGGRVIEVRAHDRATLVDDLAALSRVLQSTAATVASLCAPSTPAGTSLPQSEVAAFALDHPDVVLILDESFQALSDCHADAATPLPANVVRVRSITKTFAIPGIRAGYLLAPGRLASALESARPPWTTCALAQAALIASCSAAASSFVTDTRLRLQADRQRLIAGLCGTGLSPVPGGAPYVAFPVEDAATLRHRLLRHGVFVRDCASFGLPGHVRIAVRPERESARLMEALKEEVKCLVPR